MKLAFIIQRYGLEIIGGAEYFTRLVAENLMKYHSIEILTTCAKGYHSWENEYLNPSEDVNGILVRRFRTRKPRDMNRHARIQEKVFYGEHSLAEEFTWVDEQGPYCPELIEFIQTHRDDYDLFIFFTYRYYPSFYGIPLVKNKAVLVPFAENDPALNLTITSDLFSSVAGIIYSSPEERDLIKKKAGINEQEKVWDIIGCGIDACVNAADLGVDKKQNYMLYLGRIEGSKGCYQLFEYYLRVLSEWENAPDLILAGFKAIDIPKHDKIKYLGFVPEKNKYSLLKNARILVMPSSYESFSLVTLESMACGTPVLVNGDCDVLRGHCLRSNAGLWYQSYDEFKEALLTLCTNPELTRIMQKNGKKYIQDTYSWDTIREKYVKIFDTLNVRDVLEDDNML